MPKRVYNRAHASFRVHGDALDPLEVTLALKIPPDIAYRRGEPRLRRSKTGKIEEFAPYRFGLWSFSSEKWVDSPRLQVHLEWLLGQLEPLGEALKSLRMHYEMDFFCFAAGLTAIPPSLPHTIRRRAEVLGVGIEIDYYPQIAVEGPAN